MKENIWDIKNRSRMGQYLTSVENSFIEERLQKNPNVHSILDVGGGTGRFAIPLEKRGLKVTVIEVDSSTLWWLKTKSSSMNGLLISSQARIWPIKDSSVDCVLAIQIPNLDTHWFWQECHRVLKPGGIVIASSLNSHSYKVLFHKMRPLLKLIVSNKGDWVYRNYYQRSVRDIIKTLEENQFQFELASGYNWLPSKRDSNFFLIPFLGILEKKIGLRNFAFQSPWVIFQVRAC